MSNNKKIPSVLNVNAEGNTSSFLRAARSGNLDKVIEHLKNKIDINTSNSNGLNALHLASKDGHLEIVKELLKRGANVNSATKKGNTALHIASLAGQYDVVVTLVEHGALVNVQSQNGFTPLYMAAQENHDRVVKYLLANGANQNLATEDGFTPCAVAMQQGHEKVVTVLLENDTKGKVRLPALHIAAKKDDCKAADLLLQNDHNPDVTSKSGFTPLHIASHYGNDGIAKLLLAKGADVNYSAKHNITPLHVAAKWGKSNMVSLLLESGANIEAKTRDGLTALHCAARSGHDQVIDMLLQRNAPISSKTKNGLAALHMAAQGDHVEAAKVLLSNNAPVDDVTVDYLTGLHVAAHCGHIRVAKLLLEKHADPDARALNGFTPLHIACKKNRIKVVELLLKYNASLEATTESGLTPLHVASFMGCMNIVIFLLQHEANPDLPTVRGETPLHLAARANQTDIIRILLRNGAQVDARAREKQTPLHIASRLGNVDIVMLLLAHGAAVDSTTKDLYTALHIASKEGQEEVASVLLENEASVTATTKKGFTPLHLASKYGNIKVTKLLLQKQAPVDAQGKNGVTPLHVASHYDNQAVALMLLDKQASPHAIAKNGHTPLHIAAKKNQMDIAVTLLDYGAKANAESKAGFTPLHLSSQEGNVEMTTLLLNHNADPNYKSKNGLTPMHLSAQEDKHKVAVVLDNYHADINPETKAGFTPLHVACHFGQLNMVRFITARQGVNINATTASGYTPLHQASQQGHSTIVSHLLDKGADPNLLTSQGQTALSISQKLGYISVVEALKNVTKAVPSSTSDEKYKVISPETMQETFMSDSEDEGGDVLQSGSVEYGLNTRAQLTQNVIVSSREETMINEQSYRYLTGEEMKGFGDESAPIDVTRDERCDVNTVPPTSIDEAISPQTVYDSYSGPVDNVEIVKYPPHVGFLVSFLVDARGGAMRGCRHSGVRVIVPPRRASMPTRVTCRYLRREKMVHPPPLMEGESLASRILELGPVGAKFLGPVMIEVPNFGSLRGSEREIVVLRSENGETWREHTVEVTDEIVKDILGANFEKEDRDPWHSGNRLTRIVTTEFPHYFAIVSRVKQEVHAIGPEGGMVSSTVVPQVQAVFPQGALTKRIKVGLQAQPIPSELTAKLLGNRVAVSPIVTVEPRRRKFHKPITLTLPLPQASSKGMINHYTGDAPTLRLLCSITGGTSRAQWEDVTGSTPLTFINDCVSFTTTVSARFWLMDCRNVADASKMATELYREAIHVPFMAKFVVFAKRTDTNEARIRLFCMTDDREDKTLEHKEHFTEVSNSRDVEVLEGKPVYVEFAGNLVPVTKSGEQLRLVVRAFKENRLPFTMRVKDPSAEPRSWTIIMKEPKVSKNEPAQTPVCVLQFGLPENIVHDTDVNVDEHYNYTYTHDSNTETHKRAELRITDISNFVSDDWINLAHELGFQSTDIAQIQREYPDSSGQQCMSMLNLWMNEISGQDSVIALERALNNIGRVDVVEKCNFAEIGHYPSQNGVYVESEKHQSSQSPNNKYAAEEKAVIEDEIVKTVTERRMEIEQRLNGEPVTIEKKYEPYTRGDDVVQMTSKPTEMPAVEPIEPTEVSFEHKRMSFERGVSIEQVLQEDIPVKDKLVVLEEKKMMSIDEKPIDVDMDVDATSLTFHEKRLSFEQGIPVKEIIQKKVEDTTTVSGHGKESTTVIETEKSVVKSDTTLAEDAKLSDTKAVPKPSIELTKDTDEQIRRDSILFEEVSQGLVKLDSNESKVEDKSELLSPQSSKTPPPSPAEFKEIEQQNESKQRQTESISAEKEPQTGNEANQIQQQNAKSINNSERSPELTTNASNLALQNSIDKIPPKPNPRHSIDSSVTASLDEDDVNYTTKKLFWEEITKTNQPPLPKPRYSISLPIKDSKISVTNNASLELFEHSFGASDNTEVPEMIKKPMTSNQTTEKTVVSEFTCLKSELLDEHIPQLETNDVKENKRLDSETEYIIKYGEESLAFENEGFQEDVFDDKITAKTEYSQGSNKKKIDTKNRSMSLPSHQIEHISSKKYIQQIKPQMEGIQMEQESSPEHKSLKSTTHQQSPSQEVLINRQIHKHIFSNELDEQIDSLIPEEKYLGLKCEKSISINSIHSSSDKISGSTSEKSITKTESAESSVLDDLPEEIKLNKVISKQSKDKNSSSLTHDHIDEIPSDTCSYIEEKEKSILQTESIDSSMIDDELHHEIENEKKMSSQIIPDRIIHTPEEHIPDTIWEVTQLGTDEQDLENIDVKDQCLFHQNFVQQVNSIESLENTKKEMTGELARTIAEQLINEIEVELTKRHDVLANLHHLMMSPDQFQQLENSGYLDMEAEDLKLKIMESVLAKKSRDQLKSISKHDTITSSIEITDEDLKSSGFEIEYEGLLKSHITEHTIPESDYEKSKTNPSNKDPGIFNEYGQSSHDEKEDYYKEANDNLIIEAYIKEQQNENDKRIESQQKDYFSGGQVDHKLMSRNYYKDTKTDVLENKIINDNDQKIETQELGSYYNSSDDNSVHDILNSSKTSDTEKGKIVNEHFVENDSHKFHSKECFEVKNKQVINGKTGNIINNEKHVDTLIKDFDDELIKEKQHSTQITDDGLEICNIDRKEYRATSCILKETVNDYKNEVTLIKEFEPCSSKSLIKQLSTESSPSKENSVHSPTSPSSSSVDIREEKRVNFDTVVLRKADSININKLSTKKPTDSSSSDSHYHSFDLTSSSRPCSSDVDGLLAGSSEYESAISVPSNEYHTAISSLSSRESMKSLDSESSGNLASVENSEASETLIASTGDLDFDQEGTNSILEDEDKIEPYEQEIPMHIIRGESLPIIAELTEMEYSCMYKTQPFSQPAINSEKNMQKMKRSHEMTFHPMPKHITSDSLSDSSSHEEKLFSSEDASMSISSTEGQAIQTVVEAMNGFPESGTCSFSFSDENTKSVETLTIQNEDECHDNDNKCVTILSSSVPTEYGISHNVCTQMTTKSEDVQKKGHRRNSSSFSKILMEDLDTIENKESIDTDALKEFKVYNQHSDHIQDVSKKKIENISSKDAHVLDLEKEIPLIHDKHNFDMHGNISDKHSFDHIDDIAESDAAFQMVPHVSPAIPASLPPTIPEDPFSEDEDDLIDNSTDTVPNIMITEHMAPLIDRGFHYPDLDLEAKELEIKSSTPQTPASISSKESSDTDQGREYIINEEYDPHEEPSWTGEEQTILENVEEIEEKESVSLSESFELVDNIEEKLVDSSEDEFVVIEEIGKEAMEEDSEGKAIQIERKTKIIHKNVSITGSPQHESDSESPGSKSQLELEFTNQKWVELQFEDDNTINEVYGYNIEYERPPLEDIKEEDTDDLQSSKVGSIGSQVSHSIDSFGSMKESFSSTPESKKYLGKSLENDNISVNSLQEFERLEQLVRIESMKAKSSGSLASTTSSSNSRKDDLSLTSLKDFETIEAACFKTELIENKALATEKSLDDEEGMFKINEIIKEAEINLEQNEDYSEKHISEDDNLTSTESLDLKTIVTEMKVSASLEHMPNIGCVEGKQIDYDDCMNSSVSSRGFSSPIMDDHSKESSYRNSLILGSNDSLGPISSTSTNATYHCETGSNMSSSFTSGGSNTMVSSMEGLDKTENKHDWFDENETFETYKKDSDRTEFTHKIIRLPAEIHKVTAKGPEKEKIIEDFVEYFKPGEFQEDIERTDEHGNIFVTRIVQKRMVFNTEELANKGVSEDELNECLRKLSKDAPSGFEISKKTSTHISGSSEEITEASNNDTIKELQVAASKPELKCEISMDDDTEIDLREHDWRFQHQINTETDDITKPSTSGWTGKSKPKENVSEL
ncbi:ankyrin-2-like isoform X3 [Rhopalosiphum maidis]|uniref:ankyrin-2-like isoform X3 n=1 Tax=Rhopalosiphum maidis TaxID=43146 RepID=UPI000EFF413A|nr:ankyrin-2-like isoform X3 [Rhopalosiphum maidis]